MNQIYLLSFKSILLCGISGLCREVAENALFRAVTQ